MGIKRAWLGGAALATMLLAGPGAANAAVISFDVWYSFTWSGNVVPDGPLPTTGGGNSAFLTAPGGSPWTFVAPVEGAYLTVTDLQLDVDSFAIYDGLAFVGSTPLTNNASTGCGMNPTACMADGYSHGSFFLAAGAHSITMFDVDPRGYSGTGAFRVDAVPEPASLILLGSGLAGLGFSRRRKSA